MLKGRVIAVNASENKGTIKTPVEKGFFKIGFGLLGDAHGGGDNEKRQVSLLAKESADIMTAQGITGLDAGKFAENITTQGITLHTLPVGTKLQIGETLQEITQIGKECHKGCAIQKQVGACIMPTQGIFTKVLVEGFVKANDDIFVLEP